MDPAQSGEQGIRTIRLDANKLSRILNALDAVGSKAAERRKSERYTYRMKALRIHMAQPGSTDSIAYLAPTRNLSRGGLSFLHGGFVHPGTRCMVQLIKTHGTWDEVFGTVVSCRYADEMIHEVSLRFDREIEPAAYCTTPMRLCVLLADDSTSNTRLTKSLLKDLDAEVEVAETGAAAIEKALKAAYDLILVDVELPDVDGCEVARQLRQGGYVGPIIALTIRGRKEDEDRCIAAGCDSFLAKPITKEGLRGILESWDEKPPVNAVHKASARAELIDAYLRELPARARAVEEAVSAQDAKRVEFITRTLKVEGVSLGFAPISDLAARIENHLVDGAALADVQREINELALLCLQVRSPAGAPSTNGAFDSIVSTERPSPHSTLPP